MRIVVARAVLIAISLAGCTPAFPPVDCGQVTPAECELAVNAAVPLLSPAPDRLVVLGTVPAFVVMGCHTDYAAVVDVLVGEGGDIDAQVREGGPDIRHLCLGDPPG